MLDASDVEFEWVTLMKTVLLLITALGAEGSKRVTEMKWSTQSVYVRHTGKPDAD